MIYNARKRQTLLYFSGRGWARPADYAVAVKFYPTFAAGSYLLRLHRMGLLRRGKDASGRRVYRLGKNGANWILRDRRQRR